MDKAIKRKLPPPPQEENGDKPIEKLTKFELDKLYVRKKIEQTEVRTMAFQMDLARIRETLIEKALVEKQLAYLLIAWRQQVLAIPTSYARRLLHKEDIKEVHKILREMCYQLLNAIKDLPTKAVDPHWMETLEEEEDGN